MKKQIQRKCVFSVDHTKKKQLIHGYIDSQKWLKILNISNRYMLFASIAVACLYVLINVAFNPRGSNSFEDIRMIDYSGIILTGIVILAIGSVIALALRILLTRIINKEISPRYNEQLEFVSNELRYTYQNKKFKGNAEHTIVTISFDRMKESCYDAKLGKLTFNGEIDFAYRKITKEGIKVIHELKDKIVVYDYWNPSVHYILQKHKIDFK